jgi:hypothetical protein
MIISHKHKYLFIELPHTGTTAIARELRAHYDGKSILRKHGHYTEFLRVATPEEKEYFVFSGIRNPLDEAVSLYFKYKTDHHSRFSKPSRGSSVTRRDLERFRFVRDTNATFADYFRRFYRFPYSNWSSVSHRDFDFVVRFEHLQEDFAAVLARLGIPPVRPLPVVNKTKEKEHFLSYYTPDLVPRARRVFGPFLREWGYGLPPEWGGAGVPALALLEYRALNVVRSFYWRRVRWSDGLLGRWFRRRYLAPRPEKMEDDGDDGADGDDGDAGAGQIEQRGARVEGGA